VKKLKVGIIGLGVGEKHIEAYKSHPSCEVVSLCDFSKEKIGLIKPKYPSAKIVKNADEILQDKDINIVSIASYDNYHYEQILKAINNEKHIFVEKPLCLNDGEAYDIRKCLNDHPGLKLSSNMVLRTCPRFIRIRDVFHSGEMGRLFYIEGDYFWGRIYKLTQGWRKDMDFYSIVYGAALHMIDLILWITGMRPTEVKAYSNKITTENTPLRYDSFASILMKFEDCTVGKVTGNGGGVHPHFHRLAVFGTRKTAIHDITGAKWLNTSDPNADFTDITEDYPAKEKRGEVISSFVDYILNDNIPPIVPTNDVFDGMSVCFAAEKAMHTNSNVKVEYI